MASLYWKYVLGGVTPAKYQTILSLIPTAPIEFEVLTTFYDGTNVATIAFGGASTNITQAWVQSAIITPLGLLASANQAIPVGALCKTATDIAGGL